MNKQQRVILGVGLVVVAAMCLWLPWGTYCRPSYGRLGLQVLAVAAICGALLLVVGGRGKDGGA